MFWYLKIIADYFKIMNVRIYFLCGGTSSWLSTEKEEVYLMLGGIDHSFVSLPMLTYGIRGRYLLSHEVNTISVNQAMPFTCYCFMIL
jgi:hypothetical protein